MHPRWTTAALAALLALAPLAAAGWGAKGDMEPSTTRDVEDGWMFGTPDIDPDQAVRKVYFNGFASICEVNLCVSGAFSPNLASLGTQVQPAGVYRAFAMLGVWKDCDKDGYVGHGDNLLLEYPVALLPPEHACPATPGAHTHNDGQWVHEFLPIGWEGTTATDAHVNWSFNDPLSRVWADWGLPEALTAAGCQIAPQPTGTFHSTGGLLAYADCQEGYKVIGAVNALADATGLSALSFGPDPSQAGRSGSVLNQRTQLGESSDASYARATDCTQNLAQVPAAVTDPTDPGDGTGALHQPGGLRKLTNDKGEIASVPVVGGANVTQPAPSGPNAGGSPLGTVNETENAALNGCDRSDGSVADDAYCPVAIYACESNFEARFSGRVQPDYAMSYEASSHEEGSRLGAVLGPGTPSGDAGTYVVADGGFWTPGVVTLSIPWADPEGEVEPVHHVTWYAYVSPGAVTRFGLTLPSETAGSYGAEACGLSASDGLTRFECDRARWWIDHDGAPIAGPSAPAGDGRTYVGDPYNLRDVDCYDTSTAALRASGVSWGLLTGSACA